MTRAGVILVPGYGSTAEQPIVRLLAARLIEAGLLARGISFTRRQPREPFDQELNELRQARDGLDVDRVALVGRSFGGRMCARVAAQEPPTALVLLGHPIAPQGRPRPEDEAALREVRCPTLVIQGAQDKLGPLAVLQRIQTANARVELHVLEGVGHQFGKRQAEAVDVAAAWLSRTLLASSAD